MPPNPLPALGRGVGLGTTPLRSDDLRPGNPALVTPVVSGSGSLPARACGAIDPCGKAICPPPGGVEAGAGDLSGRRAVLDADEGIEPTHTEAAHVLVTRLRGHLEPEGLRLAEDGLVRRREVGGDHNGAPLRQERTGSGVRGRRPRSARCSRQRRERPGVRRGAQPPSPVPMYAHWVGWLSPRSGPGGPRHQGARRRGCGHAGHPNEDARNRSSIRQTRSTTRRPSMW